MALTIVSGIRAVVSPSALNEWTTAFAGAVAALVGGLAIYESFRSKAVTNRESERHQRVLNELVEIRAKAEITAVAAAHAAELAESTAAQAAASRERQEVALQEIAANTAPPLAAVASHLERIETQSAEAAGYVHESFHDLRDKLGTDATAKAVTVANLAESNKAQAEAIAKLAEKVKAPGE